MELNDNDYIIIKTEELETDDHNFALKTLGGDIETVARTADIESVGNDSFTRSKKHEQGEACKSGTFDTRLQKVCSENAINDDKRSNMSDKVFADLPTTYVYNSYADTETANTSGEVVGRHLTDMEDYTPESNTENCTFTTGNQEITGFQDGRTLIYEEKCQYDEQFAVYLNEDKEENYSDEDGVDIKVEGCSVKSSIVPFPDTDNADSHGEKSDDKIQPDQNHETSKGLTQTSCKRISESQHLKLQKKKSENVENSQENAEDSESELEGEKDSVGTPAEKSELSSDISLSYICVACRVNFTSAGRFQRHIYDSTKSMQLRLWDCPLCDETLVVRNRCKAYQHINRHDIPLEVLKEIQMKNTQKETFTTSSLTVVQVSQFCSQDLMHTESKDKDKGSVATIKDLHHGVRRVTSERHTCLACTRSFSYPWTLRCHLVRRKPSHKFRCKRCSLILPSKCALSAHSILHDPDSSEKIFMCPECGLCFSGSWSLFAEHVLNDCLHGNHVCILRCPVCNKIVNHEAELTCHMEMHIVEYFECKICFEAFISRPSFLDHWKKAHIDLTGAGTFGMRTECPHCSKTFYTDEEEKKHITQHVNETMRKAMFGFMCFDCKEETVFSSHHLLHLHKVKTHTKTDDKCSSTKTHLSHMRKVHKITDLDNSELGTMLSVKKKYLGRKDIRQVRYLCHLCTNKSFSSKNMFLNHMTTWHDIPYQDLAFETSEESVGKIHVIEIDVAVEDLVSGGTEDESSCSTTSDCQESPSSVSNTIDIPSSTSRKMPTPVSVMKVQPTTEALALNHERNSVSCAAPQPVLVRPSDTDKVVDHRSSLPPATTESHLTETFDKSKQSAVKAVKDSSQSSSILRKKQGRSSYTVVMEPIGSRFDRRGLAMLTEAETESLKWRYKSSGDGKNDVFPPALASTEKSSSLDKNKCSTVTEAPQKVVLQTIGNSSESHLTETFDKSKQSAVKAVTGSSQSSSILRKEQGSSSNAVVMEPIDSRIGEGAVAMLTETETESLKLRCKPSGDGKNYVFPPALASTEKSTSLDKIKCSTVTEAPQKVVLQTLGNSSEKYTTRMLPKPPKLIMGPVAKFAKTKTSETAVVRPKRSLTVCDNANNSLGLKSDLREGKDPISPVASASSVHTTKSVIHPKPTVINVMPQMTSPGMPRTNVPVAEKVISLLSNTNVSSAQMSPSEANRLKYDIRKCSDVIKTKEPRKYHCAECKTVFTSASKLKQHMSSQERVKFTPILICYKCRMVVPNRCALELHENLHSHEHEMPAACPECGLMFYGDWDIFMKHVTKECLHHRRVCCIMCAHCEKAIPTARFMGHFQQEHVPKWIFSFDTCMFCSKKKHFFSREVVRDHYAFHIKKLSMKDITFQFGCVTCRSNFYPVLFHDLEELWEHMKTFHQGLRSFTCTHCPLKFSLPESVDAHFASHHSHPLSVIPQAKVLPQTSMRLEFSKSQPTMKKKGNEEVETCASEAVSPVANEVLQLSASESRKVEHQFHKALEEKIIVIEEMENLETKSDTVVVPQEITCGHCDDVFLNEEACAAHVKNKHVSEAVAPVATKVITLSAPESRKVEHQFHKALEEKIIVIEEMENLETKSDTVVVPQKINCGHCDDVFLNEEISAAHVRRKHTSGSERCVSDLSCVKVCVSRVYDGTHFFCTVCDKKQKYQKFASSNQLMLHLQKDHPTELSEIKSPETRVKFNTELDAEDNIIESSPRAASERVSLPASEEHKFDDHEPSKSVDGAKNTLECIWCGSVLKSVHFLQKHVKEHHFKSGEFKCTFCGIEGLPYGRFVCHVAKRCPQNMNVTCPYCFENDFDNYKGLVTHLHQNHRLQLESCGMDDDVNTRRDTVSNMCTCSATRCDVASKDNVAESTTEILPTVACPPLQKVNAEFQAHSCKFCGLKCNTRLHFLCHVAECHSGYLPSMFCPFCEERNIETAFGSVHALRMHLSSQHCDSDEKRTHCEYCDSTSNNIISIHPRPAYQGIDANKIRCRVCYKEYSTTRVGFLMKHMKEAHSIHTCRGCKTEFDTQTDLDRHMDEKHTIHACRECKTEFHAQTDLDKHMNEKHGQQEGIDEVEHEDVPVPNKKKLKKTDTHKYPKRLLRVNTQANQNVIDKSQEKSSSELKCSICSKTFAKSGFLLKHQRTQHSIYCCKFCQVTCDSEQDLDNHILQMHDDMVPQLTCSICKARGVQKIFHDQKLLEKHLGQKHEKRPADSPPPTPPPMKRLRVEGDSVYTCAKCSFVTDDAAKFSEHIKDHNTDKASQCPECGLCFTILPALKKHLFMVHKIRDSEKYLEDKGMKTEEEELDFDAMMEPYKNR